MSQRAFYQGVDAKAVISSRTGQEVVTNDIIEKRFASNSARAEAAQAFVGRRVCDYRLLCQTGGRRLMRQERALKRAATLRVSVSTLDRYLSSRVVCVQ